MIITANQFILQTPLAQSNPSATALLEATHLECVKGDHCLFADLNFSVNTGGALRIEGVNGQGKTSLLRILCGLSLPASGQVKWRGRDIQSSRCDFNANLTYIGHKAATKAELCAAEHLEATCSLWGSQSAMSVETALQQVGLFGFEHVLCGHLSAGQQRRVALARLLVSPGLLWILDEPLTSLDKSGIAMLVGIFNDHLAAGGALVYTSHQALPLGNYPLHTVTL